MQKFIDISNDAAEPMMIPADVAHIYETAASNDRTGGSKDIKINFVSGNTLYANDKAWDFTVQGAVDAVRAAGTTLHEVPLVWDRTVRGRFFINPAAFSYITVSAVRDKKEPEAHVAFILGLKGGSCLESSGVPLKLVEDFMAAAKAANPQIKTVAPALADSRFYEASMAAYDPADVIRVNNKGYSAVDVGFAGGGALDFSVKAAQDVNLNNYLSKLMRRIVRMRGGDYAARDAVYNDNALVERVFARSYKTEERMKMRACRAFADVVAGHCPQLRHFAGASNVFHTRLDNITCAKQVDDKKTLYIAFERNKPDGAGIGSDARVTFRSEAAARKALQSMLRP